MFWSSRNHSSRQRELRNRRYRKRKSNSAFRLTFEQLEDRRLLASDWQNPVNWLDVNDDGFLAPIDALIVINRLNSQGAGPLPDLSGQRPSWYLDTDGDGQVAPIDVLLVFNGLNDTRAPLIQASLARDTAPGGTTNSDGVTFDPTISGTFTDQTGVVSLDILEATGLGVKSSVPIDRSGQFSFAPDLALDGTDDGQHVIRLRAKDPRGNASAIVEVAFQLDTVAPVVDVTGRAGSPITNTNITVAGVASDKSSGLVSVQARIDANEAADVFFDVAGVFNFQATLPSDGSADGIHSICFDATDIAGNRRSDALSGLCIDDYFNLVTQDSAPQASVSGAIDAGDYYLAGGEKVRLLRIPGEIVLGAAPGVDTNMLQA